MIGAAVPADNAQTSAAALGEGEVVLAYGLFLFGSSTPRVRQGLHRTAG
jgi:hypothetical protein